jgi:hypothetical protein
MESGARALAEKATKQLIYILAKAAAQDFRETIWQEEIPSIIQIVVTLEQSALSL